MNSTTPNAQAQTSSASESRLRVRVSLLLDWLFGCEHARCTFPITVKEPMRKTYVVCLECGKEFRYDWQQMRIKAN